MVVKNGCCLSEQHGKSSPFNSTHCSVLYPQNGDRIVTIDSVTPVRRMYKDGSARFMGGKYRSVSAALIRDCTSCWSVAILLSMTGQVKRCMHFRSATMSA